jgi:Uncharacterized protein conserved in bacteria (DUF2345)
MPIDFARVPPRVAVPEPPRPSKLLWAVQLGVVMCLGAALAIFLWPAGRPTNTLWFWFCVIGYPMFAWAFLLCCYLVGIASSQHMQLAARKQMFVTAGDGLDIGVMKRIAMAAGDAISLFAAKLGIRIFSSKGKIQIQAQGDALELMALKNVAVSSSTGEVIITGSKGITLGDGSGAYVKIVNGKIEIASPSGQIEVKGNLNTGDPAGGNFTFPYWSDAPLKDVKGDMNFGFSE